MREFKGSNGQTIRFSLFVPATKNSDKPAAKLPLVLCLHGAGGNTAAANILADAEMQKKYPCVVMAPACDNRETRWVEAPFGRGRNARAVLPELLEALDSVVKENSVDPARIYVTGQSMGGIGTWGLIAKHADRFTAAVPVCGIWSPEDAGKMNGVAIWAFHGDKDPTVPVTGSRDMIAARERKPLSRQRLSTRNWPASHMEAGAQPTPSPNFGNGCLLSEEKRQKTAIDAKSWAHWQVVQIVDQSQAWRWRSRERAALVILQFQANECYAQRPLHGSWWRHQLRCF